MNQVAQVIVSIVVFILGLCFVICLHELGHLLTAKLFRVYCEEYSIGFGPKLLSFNPKDKETGKPLWETTFNVRAIPLGGYVAMVGENDEAALTEAGIPPIPKERTFSGIRRDKQAIIMVAGIAMNVLLSFFLFFIANAFTPQQDVYTNRVAVESGSLLEQNGLATGSRILSLKKTYPADAKLADADGNDAAPFIERLPAEEKAKVNQAVDDSKARSVASVDTYLTLSNAMLGQVFLRQEDGTYYQPTVTRDDGSQSRLYLFAPGEAGLPLRVEISYLPFDGSNGSPSAISIDLAPVLMDATKGIYTYQSLGFSPFFSYSPQPYNRHTFIQGEGDPSLSWRSFGRAIGQSFFDQGNGIAQTGQALGGLFTPEGWNNVGGIVSIFRVTEQAVGIGPFYVFYLWGLISINIAVLNLIPIPGLDGWQLMLCAVESIRRKPVNKKFKTYAGLIGLGAMLILGIALIVMDVIRWVG